MKQIVKKFSLLRTGLFILCVSAIAIGCGDTASNDNADDAILIEETAPPPPPPPAPVDTTQKDTTAESRPVPIKKG